MKRKIQLVIYFFYKFDSTNSTLNSINIFLHLLNIVYNLLWLINPKILYRKTNRFNSQKHIHRRCCSRFCFQSRVPMASLILNPCDSRCTVCDVSHSRNHPSRRSYCVLFLFPVVLSGILQHRVDDSSATPLCVLFASIPIERHPLLPCCRLTFHPPPFSLAIPFLRCWTITLSRKAVAAITSAPKLLRHLGASLVLLRRNGNQRGGGRPERWKRNDGEREIEAGVGLGEVMYWDPIVSTESPKIAKRRPLLRPPHPPNCYLLLAPACIIRHCRRRISDLPRRQAEGEADISPRHSFFPLVRFPPPALRSLTLLLDFFADVCSIYVEEKNMAHIAFRRILFCFLELSFFCCIHLWVLFLFFNFIF